MVEMSFGGSRTKGFMTYVDGATTYLYPKSDIAKAFAATSFPFTFDGTVVVCPTMDALIGLYNDVFSQTVLSQPTGNTGFSCNNRTMLEDLGDTMEWKLASGELVIRWRLVRQLTPQVNPPLTTPGNSPVGTIGFVTVFCSYGQQAAALTGGILDKPSVIRLG
jgi:hypothetical protein